MEAQESFIQVSSDLASMVSKLTQSPLTPLKSCCHSDLIVRKCNNSFIYVIGPVSTICRFDLIRRVSTIRAQSVGTNDEIIIFSFRNNSSNLFSLHQQDLLKLSRQEGPKVSLVGVSCEAEFLKWLKTVIDESLSKPIKTPRSELELALPNRTFGDRACSGLAFLKISGLGKIGALRVLRHLQSLRRVSLTSRVVNKTECILDKCHKHISCDVLVVACGCCSFGH